MMGCINECEQGRKVCPTPEICDSDLGSAYGIISALCWTATLFAVAAFFITLYLNWGKM